MRSNRFAPGSYAIETSFCGAKPITQPSAYNLAQQDQELGNQTPQSRANRSEESLTGSEDLSETRNLVEEINMRTKQMPLTKQDSYANAIYNSATRAQQARKGGLRKQGSYEAAVESGAKNQAAAKRTKQIMQIRKQDSYTRAIGGSFEDEHSGENREPVLKMRKQESYLMAVGEMSPENENNSQLSSQQAKQASPRIRKQDSYLKAIGNNEDELSPLPRRVGVKKQESYQRAILKGGVGSFSGSFNAGESTDRPPGMLLRQEALERNSKGPSPSTSKRGSFKKQDSYNRAIEKGYDMLAALDRINNYEEVLRGFKEKNLQTASSISSMQNLATAAETDAAVAIQSAFKGYKVRKEIKEIQTFYQQVSGSEDQIARPRPSDLRNEPISRKKRQDSYLRAVGGLSPEEESKPRMWKIRQDSYQQAIDTEMGLQRPKRQDSYLQAISSANLAVSPPAAKKKMGHRQPSYQRAVGAVSPDADEELPDLTAAEVAHAAVKIQAAYKGFKARKVLNKNEDEEMPDLNDVQVQEATVKIQSAFKGFAARKQRAEETKAAIRIQRNFRGFVTRKHGFAHTVEVAQAAIKIQKVYRGFQTRKKLKELPDLKCADVAAAAVKIQKVYRGFQTRKKVEQDLPNLKCAKVVKATVRIQKVFRGYQTRKRLEMAQTAANAVKMQKVLRGFKVRLKYEVAVSQA